MDQGIGQSICAVYDFRANQDYYTKDDLIKWLSSNCKRWVFQLEKGDTGYIHWQGRFSLIKKRTKNVLLKLFKDIPKPNYLEPTTNEEYRKEMFYQMKEDTRLEGPFKDSIQDNDSIYIPRQYRDIRLYPWQQAILQTAEEFDDRTINLVYDPVGNSGKSTIASICELMHGGIDMPPLNDYKELVALACDICMDKEIRSPKIMFFDMPRAVRKDQLYGLYSAIEQIKKGKLYDCRYHYKCWWIDSPQIWVFTNTLPDLDMLSKDRWVIHHIVENKLHPFNPDNGSDDDTY